MNLMGEYMATWYWSVKVVVQIVYVHVAIAETPSWSNVEVPNDLVDSKTSFNPASFLSLGIQSLRVVLALTLLYILSTAESPGNTGISFSNLVASVTTARLLCICRRGCTITSTTVFGI
jgi:hypothetical protein